MDTEGLRRVLEDIEAGKIRTLAVETPAPSLLSHEILNANPYAFLDDAPLEERRARAVSLRRTDPDLAAGIGALDPEVIAEVRHEAWPEARNADEVHDALLTLGVLPESEAHEWGEWFAELTTGGRATRVRVAEPTSPALVAAERVTLVRSAFPDAKFDPEIPSVPLGSENKPLDPEEALRQIIHGWMDSIGPTTAEALSERLNLPVTQIEVALARLESEGVVLRGSFTNSRAAKEWCERGLLARIHRRTLGRLRREIEPVSAPDFLRFLFRWQHVQPGTQLHGRDGLLEVIHQLQGLELPGPAWERDVLPARIADYEPSDLENLCLAGEIGWGRLSVVERIEDGEDHRPTSAPRRRAAPNRAAPLAFMLRAALAELLEPEPSDQKWLDDLSPIAREVHRHLESCGASFLADISRAIHRLPAEVEDALWELVASGLVTGDGIAGLRTLLLPPEKRRPRRSRLRPTAHLHPIRGRGIPRLMPVGRWSLLREAAEPQIDPAAAAEAAARRLLFRYGVVLRELCQRETRPSAWRVLLGALRRLEARGEIRGGRFIDGFLGEQFALPEAVEALRSTRRRQESEEAVFVAAADPLNLVGILTPGPRVPSSSGQVIAYRNGVPVEIGELGVVLSRLRREKKNPPPMTGGGQFLASIRFHFSAAGL